MPPPLGGGEVHFKALKRKDSRVRRPRFETKGRRDRFYVHNQELQFNGKRVSIGMKKQLGWIRACEELRFDGKIMGGTVVREARHWYLSVQVQFECEIPPHPTGKSVGLDMGVANQIATSEGKQFHLPAEKMKTLERRIRRANKTLARRWSGKIKKGHADKALRDSEGQLIRASRRFRRQADRLAVLHRRLANIRLDALHKLSRQIVDAYESIAIEDLQLKNMTASAKGTAESPGRNVKAKSGLNRALLNAALRQLRIMLEYKAETVGGMVVPVDPAYTSQTCSDCGHVDANNRQTQAVFRCTKCGFTINADINAARNILTKARQSE
jgi:putative transposase